MLDAVTSVPAPVNEPIRGYAPGSTERARLEERLKELAGDRIELTATIDGDQRLGRGKPIDVVQPHRHGHVLGTMHNSTQEDALEAIAAAQSAAAGWRSMSFDDRAAIFLKAADLLAGPWRDTLNAATMLGQSKTAVQAEIDSACELIDFWRFNVAFAREILAEQPVANSPGSWNRLDHRPLEGFVYAITPFNFTAIGGNLPTAPALMGNVVLWKPSPTQQLAAHYTMRLLDEAGLPPGVINMLPGDGIAVSDVALADPTLAGIHFTGSTPTFQLLWQTVGKNIATYRSYPRIVGETGGKDFVLAHPSADAAALRTALIRGAFEFQGQKCSAASRAYVARSVWDRMSDDFLAETDALTMGDVSDFSNFMGAVIDQRAYDKHAAALERAARRRVDHRRSRRDVRRQRGLLRPPDSLGRYGSRERDLHDRVLRADPRRLCIRRRRLRHGHAADGGCRRVRADRVDLCPGSRGDRRRNRLPAICGRQLLHQRQANGRRRRPAAVRWGAGERDERQGGSAAESDALDVDPRHQGDVRAADGLPLPSDGLTPHV